MRSKLICFGPPLCGGPITRPDPYSRNRGTDTFRFRSFFLWSSVACFLVWPCRIVFFEAEIMSHDIGVELLKKKKIRKSIIEKWNISLKHGFTAKHYTASHICHPKCHPYTHDESNTLVFRRSLSLSFSLLLFSRWALVVVDCVDPAPKCLCLYACVFRQNYTCAYDGFTITTSQPSWSNLGWICFLPVPPVRFRCFYLMTAIAAAEPCNTIIVCRATRTLTIVIAHRKTLTHAFLFFSSFFLRPNAS